MEKKANNLINELSPYLLQHAYNPVDWHPWNNESIKKAQEQKKPIFLSIGYSSCHWCHVMERESFSDPEVAQMMNETFINIKVDKEERPDIDQIYMTVCQVMNGSGGWPLTLLLTPNLKPFFAGTYFPKESMANREGIKDIIKRTQEVWSKHYNEILASAEEITDQSKFERNIGDLNKINEIIVKKCFYELAGTFDNAWGGFTKKPKFPIPQYYYFLTKFYKEYNNKESLDMALYTLKKMRLGGIYDQVGKGFHRYSTDQEWVVPHFEKMLHDQALLTIAYLEAYQASSDTFYSDTANEVLEYVKKNLLSKEGGFYAAEDADSEGVEGKFYFWDISEIRKTMIGDVDFVTDVFNIKDKGNFVDEYTGEYTGKNILHIIDNYEDIAKRYDLSVEQFKEKLSEVRTKLNAIRANRISPHKDDKILTDWNAMMISAFAMAGRILANNEYTEIAKNAYSFIKNNLCMDNGQLLHRYREGISGINGMIDDYAYTINALIELFITTSDPYYIKEAELLFSISLKEFFDEKKGGFFFAPSGADDLIIRKKEIYDGATPSGNSIMLLNMIKLSSLTDNLNLSEVINKTLMAFEISISAVPSAYSYTIKAIMSYLKGTSEIIISGTDDDKKNTAFAQLNKLYLSDTVIIKLDNQYKYDERFAPYLKEGYDTPIKLYYCKNFSCNEPTTSLEQLMQIL
ncbi:MAG TPA: thioredoxin domain-containing protein [Candidatus Kapabacteria bacterium]|nr:thioredoxin domain-containing protein [Candidatus Kapabacteria bacterium]